MSYGIVRVQKFKSGDVRGIQSHDLRERESRTNPDIDIERSGQNYALVCSENFRADIQTRLATLESSKAVRKDAVVMCQFMVTSDHEFFKGLSPDKEKAFFQDALGFLEHRYGKENILSATVHKDEKTPHMHVNMTPIRDRRLTAKTIFDRVELNALHTAFHQSVGQKWGLDRGQSREDKREHLKTEDFKHQTRLQAMQKELEQAKAELNKAKEELALVKGVQNGTAQAMAQAQAWSIEKARQEVLKLQKEREQKAALEKAKVEEKARQQPPKRGLGMGR